MKFLLALPLLALLGFATTTQAQTAPATAQAATTGTATAQFKTSAVCDMCKARIEKSLAYEKGVQSAVLDVPTKVLTVTYKADKTTPAALRTAVQKSGYDADELTADTRAYNRLPDCCKKTSNAHTDAAGH
ncbi:heavy-metal-associated domain-containing protein [Hymenobacter terricola]|uniref:heavy-metal-associated domain-containing protein n=1 Tax=Hymenobacter terricola TaxID=2819236 RepID=UPI001B3167F0|nr:heavy-metal-associated domain-containing protein [Hymenobacter terricola]